MRKIILNVASFIQFWQKIQIFFFVKSMNFLLQQKTICASKVKKKQE